jgi:hypothetical protein
MIVFSEASPHLPPSASLRDIMAMAEAAQPLVREAAQRVGSRYLTVDIGQDKDSHWWVIETGDATFSSLSQTPRLILWNQ